MLLRGEFLKVCFRKPLYLEKLLNTIRKKSKDKIGIHYYFLQISTFFFEKTVKMRNFLYDMGFKKEKKAPLPVVSIGNVAVGGTGKTPFAIFLARALQSSIDPPLRIAILTRGYRSFAEKRKKPLIVSDGEGGLPIYPPDIIGDEAYLMAKNLPNVMVISGKNRFLSVLEAKKRDIQLVLLDDGMQHRKLFRDVNIAMLAGEEHSEKFLPFGNLRDDPKRLSDVDFLISRGQEFADTIAIDFRVVGVVSSDGKIRESLTDIPVAIFCGIGRPESFVKTVEECGTKVVDCLFLADHEKIDEAKLNAFAIEAKKKGAFFLLCTEKDYVKYENSSFVLPVMWVKREMYIIGNLQKWNALIHRIRELVV